MDKLNYTENNAPPKVETTDDETKLSNKPRTRGQKRKRLDSDSSTDIEDILPENTLEVEKNLHASAIKNNLDDVSVKKILKKVVTNDHVLALVKLREKEGSVPEERSLRPKLTRAKMKELMKLAPESAAWNLELSPIKGIPVKTRPEVKALIAQELQEDEDDDEYQPTLEDVQSDDDQTLESCSDLESQPRTPATPNQKTTSPKVVNDGPFKVPQDLTPARRKLIIDEEVATIALRTRSKLSLSATPIEHIESSFVPPDDLPGPVVDNLWNDFLKECLDPASVTRNEEDDEADPEYNVAADPDAHDEDEEALENSIIKISKKELNDLMNELFNVMPQVADDALAAVLPTSGLAGQVPTEVVLSSSHWEGKQEPVSDDESEKRPQRITFEKRDSATRFSIGKSEPEDYGDGEESATKDESKEKTKDNRCQVRTRISKMVVDMSVEEQSRFVEPAPAQRRPPPLLRGFRTSTNTDRVHIHIEKDVALLPEQVQILQQQLRQHIQLAASNYLQLYVNPAHWTRAPTYKQFLEQLHKLVESNPESVVNVCNLKPALELLDSWEKSVSADTPENKKMVEFIQSEVERCRRRVASNSIYTGDFTETFKHVVANSSVFLYPYLLPAMPYRADSCRRFGYRLCEDELIVLGLDQFWQYVENNPELYKLAARPHPRCRVGLTATAQLVCKHMFPWLSPRHLLSHINKERKEKDSPIYRFFEKREVAPVKHKLLPFNPKLTLYEQPEHEMPRIWVRYLAKSSKRFMKHLYKRKNSGLPPAGGVDVHIGNEVQVPQKNPLPIDFTKTIVSNRANVREKVPVPHVQDKFDIQVQGNVAMGNFAVIGNVASKENISTSSNVLAMGNARIPTNGIMTNNIPIGNAVIIQNNELAGNVPGNVIAKDFAPSGALTTESNDNPGLTLIPAINGCIITPKIVTSNPPVNSKRNVTENDPTPNTEETNSVTAGNSLTMGNNLQAANSIASDNVGKNTEPGKLTQGTTPFMVSNMYRVVPTITGPYLIPFIVQTNTVNSINLPITSVEEKTLIIMPNNITEKSTFRESNEKVDEELSYHCKCCVLLRKMCKQQTFITDFFKPKNSENKCECNDRKYPKISKRLKLLVNNYKSKSFCVYRELQSSIKLGKKEIKNNNEDESVMETAAGSCDLNDIAAVTSYQLKLTIRTNIIRNTLLKKRVNTIFSKFDPYFDDPLKLAEELYKAFEVDVIDLYKEFLGFLTAEQADKIDMFKDYFIQSCAEDLVKKVNEEINDKDRRCEILTFLSEMLVDSSSTACEMCSGLLATLDGHPNLARYVFLLFPHKAGKKKKKQNKQESIENVSCDQNKNCSTSSQNQEDNSECSKVETVVQKHDIELELELEHTEDSLTICDESHAAAMDYEADHSSCGEDEVGISQDVINSSHNKQDITEQGQYDVIDTPELTICKTEVQDYCESSDTSMVIMSDNDTVKSEPAEWNRDEDKLILEVLKQYLTPQEQSFKTTLEMVEEINVYQLILESMSHRSLDEIRERVLYLLEILILSEK